MIGSCADETTICSNPVISGGWKNLVRKIIEDHTTIAFLPLNIMTDFMKQSHADTWRIIILCCLNYTICILDQIMPIPHENGSYHFPTRDKMTCFNNGLESFLRTPSTATTMGTTDHVLFLETGLKEFLLFSFWFQHTYWKDPSILHQWEGVSVSDQCNCIVAWT